MFVMIVWIVLRLLVLLVSVLCGLKCRLFWVRCGLCCVMYGGLLMIVLNVSVGLSVVY